MKFATAIINPFKLDEVRAVPADAPGVTFGVNVTDSNANQILHTKSLRQEDCRHASRRPRAESALAPSGRAVRPPPHRHLHV